MSENELGTFLRWLREGTQPSDVGLPSGSRRRTPGLRRAELATLADISVEYLTRLEQGRDRHPSVQVLGALADALRLSSEYRVQLHWVAKVAGGDGGMCPATNPPERTVRDNVRTLLDRFEPAPAAVLNRLGDVLAYTSGYKHLTAPIGLLDQPVPNVLRYHFTDARAHQAYPDWDDVADLLVSRLRGEVTRADPHAAELANELEFAVGELFRHRFAAPPALPTYTGIERMRHPELGELRLAYESLQISGSTDQRIVAYLPADDATSTALDRLVGRHAGSLRAVNS